MPNYSQGKIYLIGSKSSDKYYIGSTIKSLKKRLVEHTSSYKAFLKNGGVKYSSFKLFKNDDYYIKLVENFPCSDKQELDRREGLFQLQCINLIVNKNIAGRTKKEWNETNKFEIAEYQKEYQEINKVEIAEYQQEYRKEHKFENAEYQKEYREENKVELAEKREINKVEISKNKKLYNEKHKVEISKQRKSHREENKVELLEKDKIYREKNRAEINQKKRAKYAKNKLERAEALNQTQET